VAVQPPAAALDLRTQDEDRRRTREAGFDAHLVKPVAPDALLGIVERATRP
jgi:CheY-like chemotaxis protein